MEQPSDMLLKGSLARCGDCTILYGLKQSPQAWFGKFNRIIQELDMTHSEADHCVFYRHSASNLCIFLCWGYCYY